jgi:DNA polymerase, archaea type
MSSIEQALPHTEELLYGSDPTPRIVAADFVTGNKIRLYQRDEDGKTSTVDEEFRPWLLAARVGPWQAGNYEVSITELNGLNPLRFLVLFDDWYAHNDAVRAARDSGETFFRLNSPVEQHLVSTGKSLFKGMVFDELRRLQIDIETLGFDAAADQSQVTVVALRTNQGEEELHLLEESEAELIQTVNERIAHYDPDVIEGHNVFNFDIPFLATRAGRYGLQLRWGRDDSPVWIGNAQQRFKVGPLTLPFTPCSVNGRHFVDTYQQIQRYDTGGKLTSYGLKNAVEALGLTRPDRVFIPGEEIRTVWQTDPDRVARYALDDVRDVNLLSELALPTEFYQTQLLPRSLQGVATGGTGEKINDLMIRAYVQQGESIPLAGEARDYPGGHAELIEVGMFKPVVKCDVESLYPSIMLTEGIAPKTDTLGAYLPMLKELTDRRLQAKVRSQRTRGAEQAMWEGLQSSFKVLINSFYGYLGYGRGFFNDFDAAERVTRSGHRIIKQTVDALRATGSKPIEVDTDGVYFVPPENVRTEEQEQKYVDAIGAKLPQGIRLTHDGRYRAMLSVRLKNYGLLTHDDRIILRGSALRNRRMESCLRTFLLDATRAFLSDDREAARQQYFDLADRMQRRALPISEFSQWAMLHQDTLQAQPRLNRLVNRVPNHIRSGERIEIYEREDGELGLVEEYEGDENTAYLLRRLHDTAARFDALFTSHGEFAAFFPKITPRTDLDAARNQEPARQLGLL